ncbi:MAG TPA: hypothetical protein DDY04_03765 [Bacteroidales bacterium]|nr:hypothetical protein [Bacteroidales bacterium]
MRLWITAVTLFFALATAAQVGKKQTITLNDGSRVTGTIVSDSSGLLKVKVIQPQIVILNKLEIQQVEGHRNPNQIYSRDKGYYIHFTTNVLAGRNDWGNVYSISFQLSNGYQFKNGVSLGLGLGIENFIVPIIPLNFDIKFYPMSRRVAPFLYARSGYGFALRKNEEELYNNGYAKNPKGSPMFNCGVGISMFVWDRAAISVGLGYRYQKVTEYFQYYWWESHVREVITEFNRIEFQVGFIFR